MKKIIAVIVTLILITTIIVVVVGTKNTQKESKDKINIITSLFPEYDFAKQIGKEKVNVQILLPSGAESHTYEPTPNDIIQINNADLFCYTSDEMEPWAAKISSSLESKTKIMQAGKNIDRSSKDSGKARGYAVIDSASSFSKFCKRAFCAKALIPRTKEVMNGNGILIVHTDVHVTFIRSKEAEIAEDAVAKAGFVNQCCLKHISVPVQLA